MRATRKEADTSYVPNIVSQGKDNPKDDSMLEPVTMNPEIRKEADKRGLRVETVGRLDNIEQKGSI